MNENTISSHHPIYFLLAETASSILSAIIEFDPSGQSESFRIMAEEIIPLIEEGTEHPTFIFDRIFEVSLLVEILCAIELEEM